jgi:hypothetical protein
MPSQITENVFFFFAEYRYGEYARRRVYRGFCAIIALTGTIIAQISSYHPRKKQGRREFRTKGRWSGKMATRQTSRASCCLA